MAELPTTVTDKMGHPFTLRPYEPADRAALEAMYEAFEPKRGAQGLPPNRPDQQRAWLDRVLASGTHVVVEVDGELCGHGMLIPVDGDRTAELANFLHQSVRNRGIGTELNRALVSLARAQRMRKVWLSVEPSNRAALRSYEKAGFRRLPGSLWAPELEMAVELEADASSSRA